jgi:hypothetical protein
MSEFGVASDFIALNAYQLLYHGFFIFFTPTFKMLIWLFGCVSVLAVMCFFYTQLRVELAGFKKRVSKYIVLEPSGGKEKIIELVYISFLIILAIIVTYFVFIYSLKYAEDVGKQDAQK